MKNSIITGLIMTLAVIVLSFLPYTIVLKVELCPSPKRIYKTTTLLNGAVITTCKAKGEVLYTDVNMPILGIYFSY